MSYSDFETSEAEYRLILSHHNGPREEPIDGLDALVLETGVVNPENVLGAVVRRAEMRNYLDIIIEDEIPIYSVESKIKLSYSTAMSLHFTHMLIPTIIAYNASMLAGTNDDFASLAAMSTFHFELVSLITPSLLNNKIASFCAKASSMFSAIEQSPIAELRNALAARKIKTGVIPRLQEQFPEKFEDRKPKIGILYGAGHSGIKGCLKSEVRTNFSLALHKWYGRKIFLNEETILSFHEYRFEDGVFNHKTLQAESI